MTEPKALVSQVPLSSEEMLKNLRSEADWHRRELAMVRQYLPEVERTISAPGVYWATKRNAEIEANGYRLSIARHDPALAALEQAIACLEVLNHPAFDEVVKASLGPTVAVGISDPHLHYVRGVNALDALLKAHEALYPSTPAPAETEVKNHG